nr:hypothetical protein [uncultured Blautia sp.]
MINVSKQLKEESKKNHNYYVTANVTLADGTKFSLEKKDFYLDGNGIIDAIDSSDFPIGVAIEKTATLSLVNDTDKFTAYNFNKAEFTIFANIQLSDRLETFRRGSFIVCRKPSIDGMLNLTLLDYMSKADREYKTNLKFPCTAGEVLRDVCQQTGIVLGDSEFRNDDFQVNNAPENTTFRAVIGMVAAIAGANARIDENDLLRIVSFNKGENVISIKETLWFDANGQTILDANEQEIITAYEESTSGDTLTAIGEIETDIDEIVVTGVRYFNDEEEYLYGSEGYVIDVSDNQLLKENAREGVKRIGEILEGFELLPFSLSSYVVGYMTFGDHVQFKDSTGKKYDSYLTDIELDFSEGTEFACKAKGLEAQGMEYPSGMKTLVKQLMKKEEQKISAYAAKLKQMNDMAANALGFYYTEILQPDGSMIAYRHDKLKLAESKIVYKTTAEGFFVTADYQGTDEATTAAEKWTSGFDSNGDAVLNILYAIGIKAKWIDTRGLTAKDNDGNITFRVNADTGEVEINGNSVYIGSQTVSDMLKKLDDDIAESKNMTMQLSNEYQTVTSDADGNISGTFPSVQTSVVVMYGSNDISTECSYTTTTSSSISGIWDNNNRIYTVTGLTADDGWIDIKATYLRVLSITKRFTVSKLKAGKNGINGLRGLQGEKGEQGIPGKDGIDGKTSHFHIKYSSIPNPTDSSQMTEESATYMGTYVDFTEADSADPAKYTWRKFEGTDGADGIPGANGIDGKTYYLHLAYADSADGETGFSVSDGTGKKYIGQYTDEIKADSTDPSKYKWTLIRGNDARSYEIEMSANILKRGADNVVTPATLTAKAYYRDGAEATRHAYAGRWIVLVSEDGVNYVQIDASTSDAVSKSYAVENLDMKYAYVRFEVYAAGGTSVKLDMQSIPVVIDVDALTREQIIDLLTNKGEWKGLYYLNGHLYISFDAALGGVLTLGGEYNGNGRMIMRRSDGTVFGSADNDGITFFQSYVEYATRYKYDGYRLEKDGIRKVEGLKSTVSSEPDVMTEDRAVIDFDRLSRNTNMVLIDCSTVTINVPSIGTKSMKTVSTTFAKLADADKCVAIYMGIGTGMLNCYNYSITGNKLTAKFINNDDITDWNGEATFQILQYSYIGTV